MFEFGGKVIENLKERGSSVDWKDESEFRSPTTLAKKVGETSIFSGNSFNVSAFDAHGKKSQSRENEKNGSKRPPMSKIKENLSQEN